MNALMLSESWQAILLALVQGATEFLPISSSAHLILPAQLLGWADQGLAFDVAVHVGSLIAVLAYFRGDLLSLAEGGMQSLRDGELNPDARMILFLIVATLPAGLAGLLAKDFVAAELRSVQVIATTTIVFGLMLGVADRFSNGQGQLSWKSVLVVGFAQVLAIIPGTSRSGITMTAALLCGLGREQAARFSFLLSIPIIAAAGLLLGIDLLRADAVVDWSLLVLATLVSAITAYLCVHFFIALIGRIGFMPFVIYRVLLGGLLFWLIY